MSDRKVISNNYITKKLIDDKDKSLKLIKCISEAAKIDEQIRLLNLQIGIHTPHHIKPKNMIRSGL